VDGITTCYGRLLLSASISSCQVPSRQNLEINQRYQSVLTRALVHVERSRNYPRISISCLILSCAGSLAGSGSFAPPVYLISAVCLPRSGSESISLHLVSLRSGLLRASSFNGVSAQSSDRSRTRAGSDRPRPGRHQEHVQ